MRHLTLIALQVGLNTCEFCNLIKGFSVQMTLMVSHVTETTMTILTIFGLIVFKTQFLKTIEILVVPSNPLDLLKLSLTIV